MEQPSTLSINDLKAQVYDLMSEAEQHQLAIQEIQQQVNEVNKQIIEKVKDEKEPKALSQQ